MTTAHPELEGIGKYEYGWADPDVAGSTAKRIHICQYLRVLGAQWSFIS